MIKYVKAFVFTLLAGSLLFVSCDHKRKSIDTSGNTILAKDKKIIVYGSENCEHCIAFRKKVDSVAVKYEFKDAEANEKYYRELLFKIQQANYKGYVAFPVVEIDGKLYVRPTFDTFLQLLRE